MIKKVSDQEPILNVGYDVFSERGYYLGYCIYQADKNGDKIWYCEQPNLEFNVSSDDYYSDNPDDWRVMIEEGYKVLNK